MLDCLLILETKEVTVVLFLTWLLNCVFRKQLEVLVPKTVRNGPFMRPQQWLNRIQERQRDVASHTALSAKALFLGKCGCSACQGEGLKSLRTEVGSVTLPWEQRPCNRHMCADHVMEKD